MSPPAGTLELGLAFSPNMRTSLMVGELQWMSRRPSATSEATQRQPPRVVIVGGGFGGLSAAQALDGA